MEGFIIIVVFRVIADVCLDIGVNGRIGLIFYFECIYREICLSGVFDEKSMKYDRFIFNSCVIS